MWTRLADNNLDGAARPAFPTGTAAASAGFLLVSTCRCKKMREMTMLSVAAITALAISSTALAGSGSRVPGFDIARNCKAESAGDIDVGQSINMCRHDETIARDELSKQWSHYNADSRRTCSDESSSGSSQSYVELQVCLEMSKEVQKEH